VYRLVGNRRPTSRKRHQRTPEPRRLLSERVLGRVACGHYSQTGPPNRPKSGQRGRTFKSKPVNGTEPLLPIDRPATRTIPIPSPSIATVRDATSIATASTATTPNPIPNARVLGLRGWR